MNNLNPIEHFRISKNDLSFIGNDLYRPECILATKDGTLWASDARGGVVKIFKDGTQQLLAQKCTLSREEILKGNDLPNGLCFTKNGEILIANFGKNCIEIMNLEGKRRLVCDSIDGKPIGKVNFVLRDSKDRLWLSISTRSENWLSSISPYSKDGYIALLEGNRARIVADNFSFTNEIRLDSSEQYLYISETCGRCIKRMKVLSNGSLINREIFGPTDLGPGGFPDGITFDNYGNLWGTLALGEKIFAITPQGELKIIFDDGDNKVCKMIDEAFFKDLLTEELMLAGLSSSAPMMTSITFGGTGLFNVYIGSVLGTKIPYFRSPVSGCPPIWW